MRRDCTLNHEPSSCKALARGIGREVNGGEVFVVECWPPAFSVPFADGFIRPKRGWYALPIALTMSKWQEPTSLRLTRTLRHDVQRAAECTRTTCRRCPVKSQAQCTGRFHVHRLYSPFVYQIRGRREEVLNRNVNVRQGQGNALLTCCLSHVGQGANIMCEK